MDANKQSERSPERAASQTREIKREGHGARARSVALEFFLGALYAIGGYFLGAAALPFGARPFGIALLCAADRRVLYVYAGLCVSAFFGGERLLLIGVYTAILTLRALTRIALDAPWSKREAREAGEMTFREAYPTLFSEHISLRMASSAVACFAVGLYRLDLGGYLFYDLYGTILSIVAAPVAVLLLCGYFTRSDVNIYRRMSGILSFTFIFIWALGDVKLYGVSLAVLGSMFVTLYITRKDGMLWGVVAGLVGGLAISPELAPAFAFAALLASMLYGVSAALAMFSALAVSVAWCAYVSGLGVLGGQLGGLLSAVVLFGAADKLFIGDKAIADEKEVSGSDSEAEEKHTAKAVTVCEVPDSVRLFDTKRRIKELCESLRALSEVFYGLSRSMQTPTDTDLRQICDNAFDSCCTSCPERSGCWGERYHMTSGEIGDLCAILHRNGHLNLSDAPSSLRARCERLPDIVEEIEHNASQHTKEIMQGDRTEIFAMDYSALSSLIAASMVSEESVYESDAVLGEKVREELSALDIPLSGVCVYGGRRRRISVFGSDREVMLREKEAIRAAAEKACGIKLCDGAARDDASLEFCEAQSVKVHVARRNLCADGEDKYCGDTTGVFYGEDGRFYALISDGMGSGREAALTSGVCAMFLKKMLAAGASCEVSLKMLNGFLRNRGSGSLHECSATVDLMELDLLASSASFYKSGAAPTYVFREGSLFKLRSHTVPVGIIRDADFKKIGFAVSAGDVVVMVSDGVTGGREECPWLFDLLRSHGEGADAERLADLIVKYAKNEGSGDDISVLIMKISNA